MSSSWYWWAHIYTVNFTDCVAMSVSIILIYTQLCVTQSQSVEGPNDERETTRFPDAFSFSIACIEGPFGGYNKKRGAEIWRRVKRKDLGWKYLPYVFRSATTKFCGRYMMTWHPAQVQKLQFLVNVGKWDSHDITVKVTVNILVFAACWRDCVFYC